MGVLYSMLKDAFYPTRNSKILMLGLDGAGKSYIMNETVTTVGFNVETVQPTKNVCFTVWDVGGQYCIRLN